MTYETFIAFRDFAAQAIPLGASLGASFAIMIRYVAHPSGGLTRLDAFLVVLAMTAHP